MHKKNLKIFVCEFITAGGFNHADLPESLAREGALMRDALLHDLAQLPYEINTTVDARLAAPLLVYSAIKIDKNDDVWQVWDNQIAAADAVWLIAPETDGWLKKLTELALTHDKKIIGCGIKSIAIATSKLATFQVLQQAGIATIATFTQENWPKSEGAWLTKPDDGAGCNETFYYNNADALMRSKALWNKDDRRIIQPFVSGQAASISCVMFDGKAQVLSCNKQLITIKNNQFKFGGIIVNEMCAHWAAFETTANKIAQAMPDLAGYVGVDVIMNEDEIMVVEINPRLTTSYGGLAQAASVNPAELIINTLTQLNFKWPTLQRNRVELYV